MPQPPVHDPPTPPTRDIHPDELPLLATGAWILGAGGAGAPTTPT